MEVVIRISSLAQSISSPLYLVEESYMDMGGKSSFSFLFWRMDNNPSTI